MTATRRIIATLAALLLAALALDGGPADALPGDYCTSARDCLKGREVCFTTDLAASSGRCTAGRTLP